MKTTTRGWAERPAEVVVNVIFQARQNFLFFLAGTDGSLEVSGSAKKTFQWCGPKIKDVLRLIKRHLHTADLTADHIHIPFLLV